MTTSEGPRRRLERRGQPVVRIKPILVDRATAAAALALSVSTFEREVALGNLPKPRKNSSARVGWLWSELVAAAEALPVSDLVPPENTGAAKPRLRRD
jgi:predicted DNA-binding transcriptional regulator AlpA